MGGKQVRHAPRNIILQDVTLYYSLRHTLFFSGESRTANWQAGQSRARNVGSKNATRIFYEAFDSW